MDRLEEMRTFVGVVEAGSITGAAERLGIAKSAVSRRLADLEERLSIQLFRRTTRRMNITDTGQSFYERCLRILADLEDSTLIARRLAPVRHVVCASPAYLAEHGSPRHPSELAEHDCLVYTNAPNPGLWAYTDPDGRQGRVQVRARLQANNGECLRQAAEDGHGIVLEPSFILYRAFEEGRLLPILRDYQWLTIYAYAVYPRTRHLSRRLRAFVDFLAERFAGVPYWDRCLQEDNRRAPAAK